MEKRLMRIEALAEYLDMSPGKLKALVEANMLPKPRFNQPRFVRWDRAEVDAALGKFDDPIANDQMKLMNRFGK